MNTNLSSRRAFLQATVGGSVALPLLVSLGMATDALADNRPVAEGSLCLFESDAAMCTGTAADVRRLGLAYQTLTLDDAAGWHAMLDTLAAANGRALAVLGRPATVFAVRNVLEPAWRVVLEGRHHHAEDGGMRHAFKGLDIPMNKLASWVGRVNNPAQYALVLASMEQGVLAPDAERRTLDLQSHAWPGDDLVSLLAWPKGVV